MPKQLPAQMNLPSPGLDDDAISITESAHSWPQRRLIGRENAEEPFKKNQPSFIDARKMKYYCHRYTFGTALPRPSVSHCDCREDNLFHRSSDSLSERMTKRLKVSNRQGRDAYNLTVSIHSASVAFWNTAVLTTNECLGFWSVVITSFERKRKTVLVDDNFGTKWPKIHSLLPMGTKASSHLILGTRFLHFLLLVAFKRLKYFFFTCK